MGRQGLPRRAGLLAAAVAAAAFPAAGPPSAAAQQAPPGPNVVFEFESSLAPVRLAGEYALDLELSGAVVEGTLAVTTDSRGRLAGTWTAGESVLAASGRVRFENGESEIRLLLKAKGERVQLKGALEAAGFTGDAAGRGTLAPGSNTFTLHADGAAPAVARVAAVLPPGEAGRLVGGGTVRVGGDPLPMQSILRRGSTLRLSLRSGGFRWDGYGPPGAEPDSGTMTWTARGWGGKVSGTGMDLAVVPPPSGLAYSDPAPVYEAEEPAAPDVPTAGGGPVKSWSVDPALPAGLSLDPATGVLSGTAAAPDAAEAYTVTATNLAGSATTTLTVGVRIHRAYSFLPEARVLTDDDYRHFLSRTHFGVKASELAAVKAAGLPAYLDDMLTFPTGTTAVESAAFAELVNPSTDPPGLEGGFPNGYQMSRWWARIMMETDRPFQEVMAFFWHDHMPVSYDVLGAGYTHFWVGYANLLRHRGAGNLRDLLLDVALDPAMLVYLDGYANNKYSPNENFAREFWELFTLGVDNGYTQEDIVQAARAFTGYRLRLNGTTGQYYTEFSTALHDAGSKTFLGTTIPGQNLTDDYGKVVDTTLANRPVAEFVVKKIFEHFCYEGPPQALVDDMAKALRDAGWELKPFLKDLFRSEAFLSRRSKAGRVKSPVEYAMGFIRSTGLRITVPNLDYFATLLDQRPGQPPTVNGWPTGTLWYSAASMVNRTNFAYFTVGDTARQRSAGIEVADILPPVPQRTDQAVLDALSDLLRVPLTAAEEQALLYYLNTSRQPDGSVIDSPFVGSNQAHLDERVRGLLYILAQHPSYQVK